MRKLSKVLSVLLAIVLLFSTASIGVEAAYSAYKDAAITRYDVIDKPVLTPDQYASMAMDEVDRMLAEENIKIEYDLAGLFTIVADFTSVDKALDAVVDNYGSIQDLLPRLGGDIQNLDFSALLECPRRTEAGATDADIFLKLLEFLADNAAIIKKVPYGATENGGLDLGPILSNFVDLGDKLDVAKIAKEALAKLVWPETPKSELNTSLTVDEYVQTFIDLVVSGNYSKKTSSLINRASELIQKYIPGITDEIDLLNDSVYTLIDKGLKIMINQVGVPFANPRLKAAIRRLCGYSYKKTKDEDGDTIWIPDPSEPDELNGLEAVFNTNFNLSTFPIASWGDDLLITHLNDMLGQIVRAAINPSITYTWKTTNGNDEILGNIITVAKKVLENENTKEFFASYVEVLPAATVNAMNDDQFVAYILRSILNGSISDVFIPNTCDTTMEVLVELVKSFAATSVPMNDYDALPNTLDSLIRMGLDIAAAGLNGITNMELEFGLSADDFADACMNWVIENYGGFVSEIDGNNGWEKLSYVVFQIIPANWLPTREDGSERDNIYDILIEDIAQKTLDFDLSGILGLLDVNEDGELNGTVIEVLLARLTGIINYIIPDVFPDQEYTTLEGLLDPDLLSSIIENLLNGLYDRAQDGLMESLIPVLCLVLDLSTPEEFGYPYISLEDVRSSDMNALQSFYMFNGSKGINTNATDKFGHQTQDKLYSYYIRSVTTNNPSVTVAPSGGFYINGGNSQTFTFSGVSAAKDSILKVTITYDVYGEKGTTAPITSQPLTATTYTYIYDKTEPGMIDDSESARADTNPKGNLHLLSFAPTTYMSPTTKLGDLEDYTIDVIRSVSSEASQHTLNATISMSSNALDPTLEAAGVSIKPFSASTTARGFSTEFNPYSVSDPSATLDEGVYTNQMYFSATKTESAAETIPVEHYIFVYDDYGLASLVSKAVNADRQRANYGTGSYAYSYPEFGSDPEDEEPSLAEGTVNGTTAWNTYTTLLDRAAAIVFSPKRLGAIQAFAEGDNENFATLAESLYNAIQQLDACAVSAGTATIKAAIDAVVPPDVESVDEDGEETRYDYDDERRTYFAREDYVSYTYGNFKAERRAAQRVLDQEKEALRKGTEFSIEPVRAAYLAHRVQIYGERLIRVRAYKEHLAKAIQKYQPLINAGQGTWSNASWNEFTRAYNFAVSVNNESIGATIGNTEKLQLDSSLRQSKVNEARSHLIKTAKRLVEAGPTVDYTALIAKINQVQATFNAGGDGYTAVSWATFETAYNDAQALVDAELEDNAENQAAVAAMVTRLDNAFKGLVAESSGGSWEFDPDCTLTVMTTYDNEIDYLVGVDVMEEGFSHLVEADGYEVEVEENYRGYESTGAVLRILDGDTVVAEYQVILYGDVDGNMEILGPDVQLISKARAGMGQLNPDGWDAFDCIDDNPFAMAADTNHDGELTGMDMQIALKIANGKEYNQAWAEDGDDIWL
ncbi:MAG: hypothetical protein IJT44_10310 [Clostridia bacterium]|nr:hypothetical protein [Clostridia bacterium]